MALFTAADALLYCFVAITVQVMTLTNGQASESDGFTSIDCGYDGKSYRDSRGLLYFPDSNYISTGVIRNVPTDPNVSNRERRDRTLRSFPNGESNCYTLSVSAGKKYLVRATFVYGNYDGLNQPPTIDLLIGNQFWATKLAQDNYKEILTFVPNSYLKVCLVKKGSWTPIISALELRPLADSMYPMVNASQSLVLHSMGRLNYGGQPNVNISFPDDPYDRIWQTPSNMTDWRNLSIDRSTTQVKPDTDGMFPVPQIVIGTAVTTTSLSLNLSVPVKNSKSNTIYVVMHFAELQQLGANESRIFNLYRDTELWYPTVIRPTYLQAYAPYIDKPAVSPGGLTFDYSLVAADNSTLPPILNAVEVFRLRSITLLPTDERDAKTRKKNRNLVLVTIAASAAILLILSVLVWIAIRRKPGAPRIRARDQPRMDANIGVQNLQPEACQFTYWQIEDITKNFERAIGSGGFGSVYHGCLPDGTQVAVKTIRQTSPHGARQFLAEAQILMRVHHKNLVSLLGYCNDENNLALVYEFMPNGSLDKHISGNSDETKVLCWKDRLRIALEVAQGLQYLHSCCNPPIVHRDIKAANILLDQNFRVKLADFGLSKFFADLDATHVSTEVAGTRGYLDPQYYRTSMLTEKSDVYSFGVVLLELITGMPPICAVDSGDSRIHISDWVNSRLVDGCDVDNVADQMMRGTYDAESLWNAVEVARQCIQDSSSDRPTMSEVVARLTSDLH